MVVAGAVARAADRRDMARLTSAARRALSRVKVTGRHAAAEPMLVHVSGGVMLHMFPPATFNGRSANSELN